jgi:hypothetical protein
VIVSVGWMYLKHQCSSSTVWQDVVRLDCLVCCTRCTVALSHVHSCTVTWGLLPHAAVFAMFAAVWKLQTVESVDSDGRLAGTHDKLELS